VGFIGGRTQHGADATNAPHMQAVGTHMKYRIEFVFDESSIIEVKAAEIEAVIHLSDGRVIILPKQLGVVSCVPTPAVPDVAGVCGKCGYMAIYPICTKCGAHYPATQVS